MIRNLDATTQKSYYGKAKVIHDTDSDKHYLKSYETIVCSIDSDGNLYKHWNSYSRTTMNHINDFCRAFDIEPMRKKAWDDMPYTECDY